MAPVAPLPIYGGRLVQRGQKVDTCPNVMANRRHEAYNVAACWQRFGLLRKNIYDYVFRGNSNGPGPDGGRQARI